MAEINPLSFGSTVDTLSNAMTGASMEHEAIANNIANSQTPGYQRQTVSFRDALAAAVGGTPVDPDTMGMQVDNDRQFALGDASAPIPFSPATQQDDSTQMRMDGSNVDIDQETAMLSENSGYGQTMSQLLGAQYTRLRDVITEQP
jgi:flagellar basal-body rod protein FlgB